MKRIFSLLFILTGCTGVLQKGSLVTGTTPTPVPTYSCSYFDTSTALFFDNLTTCQASTGAVCTSAWQTYPTGGLSLCYSPPTGYDACLVSPPSWDWNYTPWSNWCGDGAGTTFYRYRSLISCSSTTCNCTSTVVTVDSCNSAGTCLSKSPANSFDPTTSQVPSCTQGRCPVGYIPVTANPTVGTANDFCVMQFEAKPWTDTNADGVVQPTEITTSGTTPVSTSFGMPWISISKGDAKTKCQSLGLKYDLVSNEEWMTIARDIELQASNWTSGVVGTGCIKRGNSGNNDACGYVSASTGIEGTAKASPTKAQLVLSNAGVIWDFAGNAAEWVDLSISALLDSEITAGSCITTQWNEFPIACVNIVSTAYSSAGAYTTANGVGAIQNLKHATVPLSGLFVSRGGSYLDHTDAGAFEMNLESDGAASTSTGFRCVYHP